MKITVQVTQSELDKLGLWSRACEVLGWNGTVASEADQPVMLDGDQAVRIGLISVTAAKEGQR